MSYRQESWQKRTASPYERETDRDLISIELQVLIKCHSN